MCSCRDAYIYDDVRSSLYTQITQYVFSTMVFYSSHTYRIKKHSCDRRPRCRSGPYVESDVVVPALALVMVFNDSSVFFFEKIPPPPFRSHVVSTRTRDTTTDGHRNPTVT